MFLYHNGTIYHSTLSLDDNIYFQVVCEESIGVPRMRMISALEAWLVSA